MANNIKNAILKTKIEGVLYEVWVKTGAANVYVDETTTLAAKLAEIIADLGNKATTAEMEAAVSAAVDGIIAGAPGTYDTLKEIADYIAAHEEVSTALNQAIGSKVDKEEGKSLVEDTLITKLQNLDAHTHSNKAVLDGITADTVAAWDGKTKVTFSETQPADMQNGDIWVQIIPEDTTGE